MGKLIVISSPSGTGKNSIIRRLLEIIPRSVRFVTTTTRDLRPGEKHGKDYFFVSKEEFENLKQGDRFIEYNNYAGEWYGSEKEKLQNVLEKYNYVFVALDVNGKHALDKLLIPHVSIFLLPENLEVLQKRIQIRGGVDGEEMKRRLAMAQDELKAAGGYEFRVVNPEGKMEQAVEEIIEFLKNTK